MEVAEYVQLVQTVYPNESWEPYPQLCLPETDPKTFTGVLDAYLDESE